MTHDQNTQVKGNSTDAWAESVRAKVARGLGPRDASVIQMDIWFKGRIDPHLLDLRFRRCQRHCLNAR